MTTALDAGKTRSTRPSGPGPFASCDDYEVHIQLVSYARGNA